MPTEIVLSNDPAFDSQITDIQFADVQMDWEDDVGQGEPLCFYGRNKGPSTLRDCSISIKGEGSESVRLAIDVDGEHGTWAAPGESVRVRPYLGPGEEFAFWAQALFTIDDRAGTHPFKVVFSGTEIG